VGTTDASSGFARLYCSAHGEEVSMRRFLAKTTVAAFAAVGLAAAVATATPVPAAAAFQGGGWHGGGWGGGWRGGGWGGGWRGGGWGGGWRGGGWGWRGGYWNGGYWGPGWGYAGWGYPGWGWGYPGWGYTGLGYQGWGWGAPAFDAGDAYYGQNAGDCWVYRKVWSLPGGRGRYLGRHPVNVCQ
jgi:hypothetical protein